MEGLKRGREDTVRSAVERLAQAVQQSFAMKPFFGPDVTLVPMPRSSLLMQGQLWPAEVICREIVRQGLAAGIEHSLRRTRAVPKSSVAAAGQRPGLDTHLATMEATPWLASGQRITVVDDVITLGVTLFAGCTLVQEIQPGARVRAFGLLRTMGLQPNVDQIVDPVGGTLTYSNNRVHRHP
jgi:predicted amidophosphoribosyltransferase